MTQTPPTGFVLVPIEPTEAMVEAGMKSDIWGGNTLIARVVREVWSAMLAARPAADASPVGEVENVQATADAMVAIAKSVKDEGEQYFGLTLADGRRVEVTARFAPSRPTAIQQEGGVETLEWERNTLEKAAADLQRATNDVLEALQDGVDRFSALARTKGSRSYIQKKALKGRGVLGRALVALAAVKKASFSLQLQANGTKGLRERGIFCHRQQHTPPADEGLREALEPFAKAARNIPDRFADNEIVTLRMEMGPADIPEGCERAQLIVSSDGVNAGDLRRARAALSHLDGGVK